MVKLTKCHFICLAKILACAKVWIVITVHTKQYLRAIIWRCEFRYTVLGVKKGWHNFEHFKPKLLLRCHKSSEPWSYNSQDLIFSLGVPKCMGGSRFISSKKFIADFLTKFRFWKSFGWAQFRKFPKIHPKLYTKSSLRRRCIDEEDRGREWWDNDPSQSGEWSLMPELSSLTPCSPVPAIQPCIDHLNQECWLFLQVTTIHYYFL